MQSGKTEKKIPHEMLKIRREIPAGREGRKGRERDMDRKGLQYGKVMKATKLV